MNEIEIIKPLIDGHIIYFGLKYKNKKNWYPIDSKDIDEFLVDFFKTHPNTKNIKNEISNFVKQSFATISETDMTIRANIKDRNHEPWFDEDVKKLWDNKIYTSSQFGFYKNKISSDLGLKIANDLDETTNEILADLEKPNRLGKWETKGMVVGDVQSGKTANYSGLIAKAIDSGYKLIIVMSGLYNNLRAQTQQRLMEQLIKTSDKGEAQFKVNFMTNTPKYKTINGIKILDVTGDFNAKTAQTIGLFPNLDPAIFVIKKNVPVLANILIWLNNQAGIKTDKNKPWDWKGFKDLVSDKLPKEQILCDLPLLIIDDECDSASIDISRRKTALYNIDDPEELEAYRLADPSKTNLLIRRIMASFSRNAYVGYTATPMANIFIDYTSIKKKEGRDLFPRDFVKILKRYDAYQSPRMIFGKAERNLDDEDLVSLSEDIDEETYNQVKWIYDYRDDFDEFIDENGNLDIEKRDEIYRLEGTKGYDEPKGWMPLYHKQHHPCIYQDDDTIPNSLEQAIINFLINIGIRDLRENKLHHNSMLIHVSRFVSVQNKVKEQVEKYINHLKNIIQNEIDETKRENLKNKFKKVWNDEVLPNIDNSKNPEIQTLSFNETWNRFTKILIDHERFEIVQINSNSTDILDYESKKKGWNVIVIGGAAISRGLTLEGLNVSYFLRIAKTPVADTLTQMGRWFGYRKGYEDLYKVYVPKVLHILFRQFTFAMEFARSKFKEMQALNKSPIEFSMEIPTFKGWSLIAASKSKDLIILPEPLLSYFSRHHVNLYFYSDKERRERNINLVNDLIDKLGNHDETEVQINERLKKSDIWISRSISEKIDPSLETEEILKEIEKKGKDKRTVPKTYLWKAINPNEIVKFLLKYKTPRRTFSDSHPLDIAFRIKELSEHRKSIKWNFAVWSTKGKLKNSVNTEFGNKNPIKINIAERKMKNDKNLHKKEFTIGELSDPISEFMDLDGGTFKAGIDSWIKDYKSTGKTEGKKNNFAPADFKEKIRQKRSEGFFILTPWLLKPDGKFVEIDKNNDQRLKEDLYISWEIIIPPSKEDGEENTLFYNVALNRVALEHRRENLRDFLSIQNEQI